ncbi:zf-HC2 domain-containing protein [Tautonia sp. JC769]|uniref:zf-HC2 domain-containing protein n=1 Tax=Tautonia sp. JC769 TaxID=3232135 RepID=UPI003459AFAD
MPIKTCAWVRARLPLLAGGDSLGLDRWVVDRHLVRCPECRHRLESLRASQRVLASEAIDDPIAADAPSLWPDLSRRLRQARRPRARTAWGFEPHRAWALPLAGGLAAGLLVAASLVTFGAWRDPRIDTLVKEYVALDQLLTTDPPRLLKPEDPEQFERRRTRPRPRPAAAYRESHASVTPEEMPPASSRSIPAPPPSPSEDELTQ